MSKLLPVNPYSDLSIDSEVRERVKTYTLPPDDTVRLYGPEVTIVDSPQFQRLAGIKQLGTTNYVYRGALHTRFEHSLGTLQRAEEMLQAVARNRTTPGEVEASARRVARLACLLHDLPHVPYGHTLEDEFSLLQRHDKNPSRMQALLVESHIGDLLRSTIGQDEFEVLVKTLEAKTDEEIAALKYPYVGDIVGNTLCADLLDYVPRDLAACGMPVTINRRFLDYLTLTGPETPVELNRRRLAVNIDKAGMPRPDVESEIVALLTHRYTLAERVYFHHAKNAASVMIGRAVQALGLAMGEDDPQSQDDAFLDLTDDVLLQILANPDLAAAYGIDIAPSAADRALCRELGSALRERRLYKVAFLAVKDDLPADAADLYARYGARPQTRRELEDRIAALAGADPGQVLIHLPRPKMMHKDADVRVLINGGQSILKLSEWDDLHSRRIRSLNEAHQGLWRLTVYVHPAVRENEEKRLRVLALAEEEFNARSRVNPKVGSPFTDLLFDQFAPQKGWLPMHRPALAGAQHSQAGSLQAVVDTLHEQVLAWSEENGVDPPTLD
ncbi:HD domain-containing protein [Euzebya sp.]|uniref:HD domain-containing protein n=1 Tax=Euzebya sp. TaxID=1971409 RepID=UPI0035198697